MSDQSDQARLKSVGESLANMLSVYGLRRASNLRIIPNDYTKGWWIHVANWSRERPKICVWFDHTLEVHLRRFWFGFQSPHRERVKTLVNELRGKYEPAKITAEDWIDTDDGKIGTLNQSALEKVQRAKLWYEHYTDVFDDYDYFGIEEHALQFNSTDELVSQAASLIGEIVEYVDPRLVEDQDVEEIKKSEHDPSVRQALILARRGQGKFRADLFDFWNGCAVSKCTFPDALRASHIKPWKKCTGRNERLDPNNGLLLIATLDSLFDRGFISFKDDGTILISPRLSEEDRVLLGLNKQLSLSKPLLPKQCNYLRGHREIEFKA
jgi:HNH endonuclease